VPTTLIPPASALNRALFPSSRLVPQAPGDEGEVSCTGNNQLNMDQIAGALIC